MTLYAGLKRRRRHEPSLVRDPRGEIMVREGETATFRVRLSQRPTGDVAVTAASRNIAKAMVSPSTRTFTRDGAAAWNLWQEFTVEGIHDPDPLDENVSLDLSPAGGGYDSAGAIAVEVFVTDDEERRVWVSNPSLALGLADGLSRGFGVRLGSQPTGEVTVAASISGSAAELDRSSLTFDATDWSVRKELRVSVRFGDPGDETITLDPSGADYGAAPRATIPVAVARTVPDNLANDRASGTSPGFRASWNAVPGATSYTLRYKREADSAWTEIPGITATERVVDGLEADTSYDWTVRAVRGNAMGGWADERTIATHAGRNTSGGQRNTSIGSRATSTGERNTELSRITTDRRTTEAGQRNTSIGSRNTDLGDRITSTSGQRATSFSGSRNTQFSGSRNTQFSGSRNTQFSGSRSTSFSGSRNTAAGSRSTQAGPNRLTFVSDGVRSTSIWRATLSRQTLIGSRNTTHVGSRNTQPRRNTSLGSRSTSFSGSRSTSFSGSRNTSFSGSRNTSTSGSRNTSTSGSRSTSYSGRRNTQFSGSRSTSRGDRATSTGQRNTEIRRATVESRATEAGDRNTSTGSRATSTGSRNTVLGARVTYP